MMRASGAWTNCSLPCCHDGVLARSILRMTPIWPPSNAPASRRRAWTGILTGAGELHGGAVRQRYPSRFADRAAIGSGADVPELQRLAGFPEDLAAICMSRCRSWQGFTRRSAVASFGMAESRRWPPAMSGHCPTLRAAPQLRQRRGACRPAPGAPGPQTSREARLPS